MSGVRFTCDIDFSELDAAWQEAMAELARGVNRGVERGVTEGAAEARSSHRYQDRTGALTASIGGHLERSAVGAGGQAIGVLEATAKHASFVESGTAPHDIYPKEGEGFVGPLRKGQSRRDKRDIGTARAALRWEGPDGLHFARHVHHPGGRPYPFMGPAVLKAERVIEVEVELATARAAAILER
jgi:hypothetical protein